MLEKEDLAVLPAEFRVGNFMVFADRKWVIGVAAEPADGVTLPDKALAVLLHLARAEGRVCRRDELLDAVWGVDREAYDRVLDNAIRDIRRAFGDSARRPGYVKTISKVGYCLVAEVTWAGKSSVPDETDPGEMSTLTAVERGAVASESGQAPTDDEKTSGQDVEAPPARARRLDRSLRLNQGFIGLLGLGLLWGAWSWWLEPRGVLRIAVGGFHAEGLAFSGLEGRLKDRLEASACSGTTDYRIPALPFWADLRLEGELLSVGDRLRLSARLHGRAAPTGSFETEPLFGDVGDGPEPLLDELVLQVHHRVDQWICGRSDLSAARAACHCRQAGTYLAGGRQFDTALRFLQRAHELEPERSAHVDALANVYQVLGRDDEARVLLQSYLGRIDDPAAGDPAAGGPVLGDLAAGDPIDGRPPGDPQAELQLRRRLAQVNEDFEQEERLLIQLRDQEDGEIAWRLAHGWFLQTHRAGCEQSLVLFRDAVALDERNPHYWAYLGEAELECGDRQKALAAFERYVRAAPQSPDALDGKAYVLRLTGQRQAAAEALRQALRLDPSYLPVILQRGELYRSMGNLQEAERQYQSYRQRAPGAKGAARGELGLAKVALQRGDLQTAGGHVEAALEAVPDWVPALTLAGRMAVAEQDWSKAENLADRIRALRQDRSTLWQMEYHHRLRGEIALARGQHAAAIQWFQKALELHPADSAPYRLGLARAFEQAGRSFMAISELDRLLQIDPQHPEALCVQGSLALADGEWAKAAELWDLMNGAWIDGSDDSTARACRQLRGELQRHRQAAARR